ncbi:ABC transporter ATP-binding protein [Enterococcus phoeniculicola]|jgi:putative ABC transport system ATP-binding protein|uniref:ABC transporter ATP-binding protein n=1 Tax=Enterococcus phoeniculicola ATCC BAA-412 TaxID=1158610 RepID=R3TLP5_9ENTE|nr:ABC transporter ATP-binding protein [Enterococcus phoeniculicola]EOL42404.1 ABC transporter ATP-binding protein [Enterococcus phoeniculicola ATCC BAA-412]EOT79317.1 ABC transporter ATP-binding protein [Enterococcus phoeniculicola ATCC BAA-412]OJG73143.1 ABC transporter ATP-binding protein [Enterococcus phoeniculicola]
MLTVQQLTKVYGDKIQYEALKGINLTVEDGEFVGIMGPSGSGKSTLLNLLATIDQPTSGEVLLNGQNPNRLNQEDIAKFRRRELGFVFQSFNLMPTLTVEENIILPLTLDGEKIGIMKRKLKELAPRLGIQSLLKKRIAEISGGQAQRVAVARAMIHQPNLLLADEPTGNLDTKSSKDVMGLLRQLNEEENATILMVTHDPLAASYCKRIVFIKDGELIHEIARHSSQKSFYEEIMIELARIEGVDNEF